MYEVRTSSGSLVGQFRDIVEMADAIARLHEERIAIQQNARVMTCVFCGHQYPPGTPSSNHDLLRDHVLRCPSHPARQFYTALIRLTDATIEHADITSSPTLAEAVQNAIRLVGMSS